VVWSLRSPGRFCLESHIHAWNMTWGWLAERKIWFSPIYGRVVRGSPWHGWFLHMLIRYIFLLYSMSTYTCYYVALMVILSWFLFWLYVGYKHGSITGSSYGSWYVWFVNEWLMNAWPNKCYYSYYERELDVPNDSQRSIRPLCSNMHSWPVDYMFLICLTKWLLWLGPVSSSFLFKFVCLALFTCHYSF